MHQRSYYAWSSEKHGWLYMGSSEGAGEYIRSLRACKIATATVHHDGRSLSRPTSSTQLAA